MIFLMVENLSNNVIRSQVLIPLMEISQEFGVPVDLLAMERKPVWDETNGLQHLYAELAAHKIRLHVAVHHGRRHPRTYLNLLGMLLTLLLLLLKNRQQVIFARNFHAAFTALPFRFIFPQSYLALDIRGAFVHELVLKGVVQANSSLHRLLLWMEAQSFRHADYILGVSGKLVDYAHSKLTHPVKTDVIPCCVSPHFFEFDAARVQTLRNELGLSDKFVVVYIGSLSSWNLLEPMLDLYEIIRGIVPNSHFLFLTRSVAEATAVFEQKGWTDFTVTAVEHAEAKNYIAVADLALLLREDNMVNRVASPVKFGEYLACGVPVCVTPAVGDLSELVAEHQVGYVVDLHSQFLQNSVAELTAQIQFDRDGYQRRCQLLSRRYFSRKTYYPVYQTIIKSELDSVAHE